MRMHRHALVLATAATLAMLVPAAARSQSPVTLPIVPVVLDFEALSTAAGCGDNTIGSYGGLDWSGWGAMNKLECGGSDPGSVANGYWYGAHSGKNSGYLQLPFAADPSLALSGTIAAPVGRFNLIDGWLTAAWTRRLRVTVTGYRGPTMVGTRTFLVDYDTPLFANFALFNLTAVRFDASGGTNDPTLDGLGNMLVMDDMQLSFGVVPEPTTLALLAPGLLLAARMRRRRPRPAR